MIIAVGVGTGVGINALLSRSLGEKNFERAGKIAGNAIFIGLCTYIVFMLFGFFGTDAFLKTQTHDSLALKLGGEYLGICCVLSFGAVGSMIFEKAFAGNRQNYPFHHCSACRRNSQHRP